DFVDDWLAIALAAAQNSLGELNDPPPDIEFGAEAMAEAEVTFAKASAHLDAASLTGSAEGTVDIPICNVEGRAVGRGSLNNTFSISGGTGPVAVTFSLDIDGLLKVKTGRC